MRALPPAVLALPTCLSLSHKGERLSLKGEQESHKGAQLHRGGAGRQALTCGAMLG